ncbi:MAG: beta galactosidase jelly roll domain-containing protein [Bacteroidales bacterium]|nr:beta galactosidase jelly roll domain-containing protein [Bacteroidales bacterium]MBN2819780.1 beta galactosidase jelly roll domain-containing protein [Bacteroidales bacterium]
MKNVIFFFCIVILTLQALLTNALASDLEPVVRLDGYWKFNIGDNMNWAKPAYDDSDWDDLRVPGSWEDQGYVGYDGYAWYRKKIMVPETSSDKQLYIELGHIDDVNQVFINGHEVGKLGVFPPDYVTAYDAPLTYYIPKGYINFGAENIVAVRVYDDYERGGIYDGDLFIGYDLYAKYLDYDLSGNWKIFFTNEENNSFAGDEIELHDIRVPSCWEIQGYAEYDGYAGYIRTFSVPKELENESLYISLGKIDDKDKVYINRKYIGSVKDMYSTSFGKGRYNGGDWQIRRVYKIPKGVLKPGEKNSIIILVHDEGGVGGIHEGPIGLMTYGNYKEYEDAFDDGSYHYSNFVEFLIDVLD